MDVDKFNNIAKILSATILLCLIVGCAKLDRQQLQDQAYEVQVLMGDVISLPHCKPAGNDQLRISLDSDGIGHVIAGCDARDEIRHYELDQEGIINTRIITSSKPPKILDTTIDRKDTIHVLVEDQRYTKQPGKEWVKEGLPPWKKIGIKPKGYGFVKGSPELVWAFLLNGIDVDSALRTDIYAFGILIFPWVSKAEKLVIAPENKPLYFDWLVLDKSDAHEVWGWDIAAGEDGTYHVIYSGKEAIFTQDIDDRYRHAVFSEKLFKATAIKPEVLTIIDKSIKLYNLSGKTLKSIDGQQSDGFRFAKIATDPLTGNALVVWHSFPQLPKVWFINKNGWEETMNIPTGSEWHNHHLSPAGNDRFHCIVDTYTKTKFWSGSKTHLSYLLYNENHWSLPIQIDSFYYSGNYRGKPTSHIASSGGNEALIAWFTETSLLARWIRVLE